jgi:hypothetical protein
MEKEIEGGLRLSIGPDDELRILVQEITEKLRSEEEESPGITLVPSPVREEVFSQPELAPDSVSHF